MAVFICPRPEVLPFMLALVLDFSFLLALLKLWADYSAWLLLGDGLVLEQEHYEVSINQRILQSPEDYR